MSVAALRGMRSLRRTAIVALVACMSGAFAACHEELGVGDVPGDAIEVESLGFEGVESIDEARLKAALATRPSSRWPWGTTRYFDRLEFERDLDRIPAFYADQGFPNARIVSFDADMNDQADGLDILIVVDEGIPLRVASIDLEGFDVLPQPDRDAMVEALPLQPGDPLDREQLVATVQQATDTLRNRGYPHARVAAERDASPTSENDVVVHLRATPGDIAWFGPIDIVGNSSVDDGVIRSHLSFRPGEQYEYDAIKTSVRRLYALDLFEFASIEQTAGTAPSEVPTRITVTEGDHRRLRFSFGYGSEERARGEVEWRHVNFFGGARTMSTRAKASWLDRGIEGEFVQPALFNPDLTLGLNGQWWYADEPAYTAVSRGGRAALTRTFGAHTSVTLTGASEYQRSRVTEEALLDPELRDDLIALGLDPTTGEQSGLLSTIGVNLSRQTVDNLLDPRSGLGASIAIEQAGSWLPGPFDYYSLIGEGRAYATPRDWITLAGRVRYGTIDPIGGSEDVPFYKRFFLGGASSLRGWGRFQVAPLAEGLPVGGLTRFEASGEVRTRPFGKLGVVLFADAGQVWTDPWQFDGGELLYDAGPGLRYDTPIGPARLDIAYQLNTIDGLLVDGEPQRRAWRLHFSIGQAF